MEKLIGFFLLAAVAFRLAVLYIFPQSSFLKQLSLLIFVAVMIAAIIVLIWKWLRWRNQKQ